MRICLEQTMQSAVQLFTGRTASLSPSHRLLTKYHSFLDSYLFFAQRQLMNYELFESFLKLSAYTYEPICKETPYVCRMTRYRLSQRIISSFLPHTSNCTNIFRNLTLIENDKLVIFFFARAIASAG